MTTLKTKPHRAVSYSQSGIESALKNAGSLEAETKYDGVRANLIVQEDGDTAWLSRESKPLPALSHLNGVACPDWRYFLKCIGFEDIGVMIDGEAMVKGLDFNKSSGLIRTKNAKPNNWDWDYKSKGTKVFQPTAAEIKGLPFELDVKHLKVIVYAVVPLDIIEDPNAEGPIHSLTRLRTELVVSALQSHFPEIEWVLSESTTVYDLGSLQSLYEEKRAAGEEGLIIKDPLCAYKRGKKSGQWKMKPEREIDGTVCGLMWGTEGLAHEGKVIGFEVLLEDGMVVRAGNISQELMAEFTEKYLESNQTHSEGEAINPYDGHQVQVKFMERFPDGSLRHPSFDCFRGTEDNPTVKS